LNNLNPKKLLNTKWTAQAKTKAQMQLRKLEKHFAVTKVVYDEDKRVLDCKIEAVITRRIFSIEWRCLKDESMWLQGWK
jgi:tryptophan-rich hypothetical protein